MAARLKSKTEKHVKHEGPDLTHKKENGYADISKDKLKMIHSFAEGYKNFLNTARTERESVDEIIRIANAAGYVPYDKVKFANKKFATQNFYVENRGKSLALVNIGKRH
ncbi:MAG TPA: aminopeptidase, partial [Candidatus Wallbacteria bacterium]|nr:aminopeptidase [Candidatus Wallbacteria bacterium]